MRIVPHPSANVLWRRPAHSPHRSPRPWPPALFFSCASASFRQSCIPMPDLLVGDGSVGVAWEPPTHGHWTHSSMALRARRLRALCMAFKTYQWAPFDESEVYPLTLSLASPDVLCVGARNPDRPLSRPKWASGFLSSRGRRGRGFGRAILGSRVAPHGKRSAV